jgi:hypothetical protein
MIRSRRGALAAAGFLVGLAATFGPLAWRHASDPLMNKRGEDTTVFVEGASAWENFNRAAERYLPHFGLDFLFLTGDDYPANHGMDSGLFHLYALPLMLIGAGVALWRLRRSQSARVLGVWLLVYPLSDCLSTHPDMHALRSLPGLAGLAILAGLGAASAGRWLRGRDRRLAIGAAAAMLILAAVMNVQFARRFFGPYNRRPEVCGMFHCDLVEALRRYKGRLDEYDAVVITPRGMRQPQLIAAMVLDYPPRQWFQGPREVIRPGTWDVTLRMGKIHFAWGRNVGQLLEKLQRNDREDRVLMMLRPNELGGAARATDLIRTPGGELRIYELSL